MGPARSSTATATKQVSPRRTGAPLLVTNCATFVNVGRAAALRGERDHDCDRRGAGLDRRDRVVAKGLVKCRTAKEDSDRAARVGRPWSLLLLAARSDQHEDVRCWRVAIAR